MILITATSGCVKSKSEGSKQLPTTPVAAEAAAEVMAFRCQMSISSADKSVCWHAIDATRASLPALEARCKEKAGESQPGRFCSQAGDVPLCVTSEGGIRFAAYYTGKGWTSDEIKTHCSGELTLPTPSREAVASCLLKGNGMEQCTDFKTELPEMRDLFRESCPGEWKSDALCDVPAGTQGCRIYQRETATTQVVWHLNKSSITDDCAADSILIKK